LNTNDIEAGKDEFDRRDGLRRWLADHALIAPADVVTGEDAIRVRGFREALRVLLAARDGAGVSADIQLALELTASDAPLAVRFGSDGSTRVESSAPGVDGALGRLLGVIHRASIDETWERLRVCANDRCRWAYYDHSRNRAGRWCTMLVCGGREKARTFRGKERLRSTSGFRAAT
jgi:predicted RNA-binding Zn ribbon-like protein